MLNLIVLCRVLVRVLQFLEPVVYVVDLGVERLHGCAVDAHAVFERTCPLLELGEQFGFEPLDLLVCVVFESGFEAPDFAEAVDRFSEAQARFQELGGYDLEARAHAILAGLGFETAQVDGDVGALSGGWKMRVALAQILLARPDLLLLDEPTNYLDIESILWLETFLRDYPGTVIMTCHDREIMNRVVKKIIEIDGGALRTYGGNYDFYEKMREIEAQRREAEYARQQARLAKESRFIERFKTHVAKSSLVQSRVKKLDKIEKIAEPKRLIEKSFEFRPPPRSGDDIHIASAAPDGTIPGQTLRFFGDPGRIQIKIAEIG